MITTQHLSLLTVEQCAELLQCSTTMIERFIRAGEIRCVCLSTREAGPGQRGPKGWRISPAALQEFITLRDTYRSAPDATASPVLPLTKPRLPVATGPDGKSRLRTPKKK